MDLDVYTEELKKIHKESYAWAIVCCRDKSDARDILQQSYLKVFEGKARFAGKSSLKSWFFSVVKFTAIDFMRAKTKKHKKTSEFMEQMNRTVQYAEIQIEHGVDITVMFKNELNKLSPKQQEVLHLVFYSGLTIEAAAKVMGVGIGSARTHYKRGKEKLRTRLVEFKNLYEYD